MSKHGNSAKKSLVDYPEKKPSVFERLGTKSAASAVKNICQHWAQHGSCPFNNSCKYAASHVLISPSKRLKTEKFQKQIQMSKKHVKDDQKKLPSKGHHSPETDWERWGLGDLEGADEKALERRRLELQHELQLQLKKEKELVRKKERKIDKKRTRSSSSSSSSSSDSSTSSTSSTSSSEPRKRSKKRRRDSSSSDSDTSVNRGKKGIKRKTLSVVTKNVDKKDKYLSEHKSKVIALKKPGPKRISSQKKSQSPSWNDKSRIRSPTSKQFKKNISPSRKSPVHEHRHWSASPGVHSKEKERLSAKSKSRAASPKKVREESPRRENRKVKESVSGNNVREKSRVSPSKTRTSPSRSAKESPHRSRRSDASSDRKRCRPEERKYSPHTDRSRDRDRRKDIRRGRSSEEDNGGLKKGGKILPLKANLYSKEVSKDGRSSKSTEKGTTHDSKNRESEHDRVRTQKDKERTNRDKLREHDRSKDVKGSLERDRRTNVRDRNADLGGKNRGPDRSRDRDADRERIIKKREAERQKERDEALERCRERQRERERERERLEKERREKEEEKKRQRELTKQKEFERELPSLLSLKTENPHSDLNDSKLADKHSLRDSKRTSQKMSSQDRDPQRDRDRGSVRISPTKDHDRGSRRSDENDRKTADKIHDSRRPRDVDRLLADQNSLRRLPDNRRAGDERQDTRRGWEDSHVGRRPMDDRRQPNIRRHDDYEFRHAQESNDEFADDRRGRKLGRGFSRENDPKWDINNEQNDYKESDLELRENWGHQDRHRDWNSRYDQKWHDREDSRGDDWGRYPRRPLNDEWKKEWPSQDKQSTTAFAEPAKEDEGRPERLLEPETSTALDSEETPRVWEEPPTVPHEESVNPLPDNLDEVLSDISDDADDILNQDDEPVDSAPFGEEYISQPDLPVSGSVAAPVFVNPHSDIFFDQRRPLFDGLGERSLDFEEISDEELEEEARMNKGIVDVLGADWAGLMEQTRPKPKRPVVPGSARRRWKINKIIDRIGISVKYAGEEFVSKLLEKYKNIEDETDQTSHSTKEDGEENGSESIKVEVKKENCILSDSEKENVVEGKAVMKNEAEAEVESEEKKEKKELKEPEPEIDLKPKELTLLHPIPSLHMALKERNDRRASMFLMYSRFKRALSARTDLSLRRELCNLPAKEPLHFGTNLDPKLFEVGVKLFQRSL